MRQETGDRRQEVSSRRWFFLCLCLWSLVCGLWSSGCGYTTRPGLAAYLKTVYVKPFVNKIDLTAIVNQQQFPIYRHAMELSLTTAVIDRFQFTGLLRPVGPEKADCRLEGELVEFRRDALRYDANQQVEEWRLNVVVNLRFYDLHSNTLMWEEQRFTGDTTYFAIGTQTESEASALNRALEDLARRIVEHVVEYW